MSEVLPNGYQISGFTVTRQVGAGGFAYTYLVETRQGHRYILKELFPRGVVYRGEQLDIRVKPGEAEFADIWENSIANFKQEATALHHLGIETIPRLIDLFRANGTYYLVQEFVDGDSMEALTKDFHHRLSDRSKQIYADQFLRSLLNTLSALHQEGILHRDIKPSNIIVRNSDEMPVLIDFGGVRFQIGGVTYDFQNRVWSPGYSSPEQISTKGIEQSESSDLYALAATFYNLLFAKQPPDSAKRLVNVDEQYFHPALAENYEPGFLKALDKAFMLEREDRFRTANEWLHTVWGGGGQMAAQAGVSQHHARGASIMIGRDPGVGGIMLDVSDPAISRKHLEVTAIDSGYLLTDYSSNGSWLIDSDGTTRKIDPSVTVPTLEVDVNLAGYIYRLSDLV